MKYLGLVATDTNIRKDGVRTSMAFDIPLFELLNEHMSVECAMENYSYLSGMMDDVYYSNIKPSLSPNEVEAWSNNWTWETDNVLSWENGEHTMRVFFYLEDDYQGADEE